MIINLKYIYINIYKLDFIISFKYYKFFLFILL